MLSHWYSGVVVGKVVVQWLGECQLRCCEHSVKNQWREGRQRQGMRFCKGKGEEGRDIICLSQKLHCNTNTDIK